MRYIVILTLFFLSLFYFMNAPKINDTNSFFSIEKIFDNGRFPSLAVSPNGTVLAIWGKHELKVRRSVNEGVSFDQEILISSPAINGGGVISNNEKIIAFSQTSHPPSEKNIHISHNDGLTWKKEPFEVLNDPLKQAELHFAGSGRTLLSERCRGRLIRPSRVYGVTDGYNNAMYSDDNGSTWSVSKPFPMKATGEGSIIELKNGKLLYHSRVHWFSSNQTATYNKWVAESNDCGVNWQNLRMDQHLPDGPIYRNVDKGHGPSHQGHFGLMGDIAKLELNGNEILIYSNVDSSNGLRKGLALWLSYDNGETWPVKKVLHPGPSAYSSLAALQNNEEPLNSIILVLFEGGVSEEYEGAFLARLNLKWLLEPKNKASSKIHSN